MEKGRRLSGGNLRSRQLDLTKYDTDKIPNGYLHVYDTFFAPYVDRKIVLLELGVAKGGSLLLWRDYFPAGTIVGIDWKVSRAEFTGGERIHLFEGSQADPQFLSDVAHKVAPEGFDIIIDDASHIGELTRISFWHLFTHHLKPGGLYSIEDWGTGYWSYWPDGKLPCLESFSPEQLKARRDRLFSKVIRKFMPHLYWKRRWRTHTYGMVGLIKQLVDEQGAFHATRFDPKGRRPSRFEFMMITPGIMIVKKSG